MGLAARIFFNFSLLVSYHLPRLPRAPLSPFSDAGALAVWPGTV